MAKAMQGQTTNLRKCRCACTIEGVKHNIPILAGEGHIVRVHSTDYKVYCQECYDNISKRTATNNKVATIQADTVVKTVIIDEWQHQFEFYINNKNLDAINLLKRLHYTISNGGTKMVKAISPLENNLNGIQKNFTNLVENFNLKANASTKITTYRDKTKISTTKTTIDKAIEEAKKQRIVA